MVIEIHFTCSDISMISSFIIMRPWFIDTSIFLKISWTSQKSHNSNCAHHHCEWGIYRPSGVVGHPGKLAYKSLLHHRVNSTRFCCTAQYSGVKYICSPYSLSGIGRLHDLCIALHCFVNCYPDPFRSRRLETRSTRLQDSGMQVLQSHLHLLRGSTRQKVFHWLALYTCTVPVWLHVEMEMVSVGIRFPFHRSFKHLLISVLFLYFISLL